MRMWQSLRDLICRSEPLTILTIAAPMKSTTEAEAPCRDEAGRDSPTITDDMRDAMFWDQWWKDRLSRGSAHWFMFPMIEAPLVQYRGCLHDLANSDHLLIAIMAEYGLRTILCVGSGISQEPRALAEAGFDVTALDLSPTALRVAEAFELDPLGVSHFCGPEANRTGGHVDFVVGNLLDTTVCPGPFDVIIERRTVQGLREEKRAAALEALAARLGEVGILLSHCNRNNYSPTTDPGLFHASESWFRERDWTIWDGAPGSSLAGRVAWLIRSAPFGRPTRVSLHRRTP
jgi:hypothetical protein